MPAVACPECEARVSVPGGTWANTEVTCPACCATFFTPESADFPPKPAPTKVVGGRSDYLDAENFTTDPVVKKPKHRLVVSGPVTVAFIVGSVVVAALAGSTLVYTTLKVQGRVAGDARPGGNPLGHGPKWADPIPPPDPPAPAVAAAPARPREDRPRPPAFVGADVGAAPVGPPAPAAPAAGGFAPPATEDEAWALLAGTWKLAEKPAVDPQDEPSLQKLTFGPDKSAVLTDNLFEHSKGKSPNFEERFTVTAVKVTKAGVVLHLTPKADGDDETLALSFDAKDRITVQVKPREAGPVYLFRFARD